MFKEFVPSPGEACAGTDNSRVEPSTTSCVRRNGLLQVVRQSEIEVVSQGIGEVSQLVTVQERLA